MIRSLLFFLFFATFLLPVAALAYRGDEFVIDGNFSVVVLDQSMAHTPVVEFFRDLEQVARRFANIGNSGGARKLLLVLDPAERSGKSKFIHSRQFRQWVLTLPSDYRSLTADPEAGRMIASALVQTRMGNTPQHPLPPEALWIADGIWSEFALRQKNRRHIMHFTYLEALRNAVEQGFELKLDPDTLAAPLRIRRNSAEWLLYSQRAQLMIETAVALAPRRTNLLKDYCFLLLGGKLSGRECFIQTFGTAARRKLNSNFAPGEVLPQDESAAGLVALNRLALKKLYSPYAPMSVEAWEKRLHEVCRVSYTHPSGNVENNASLTDLPLLVEKYEDCASLPRLKIFFLNELAALAPLPLRTEVMQLALQLGRITTVPAAQISREMKDTLNLLQQKINNYKYVENELKLYEDSAKPLLYDFRLVMDDAQNTPQLPKRTGGFIDAVENANRR